MFTKFIEATINGKDAALELELTIEDNSFDHHFGTERASAIDITVVDCEGCEYIEAVLWTMQEKNRRNICEWVEKQIELAAE